MRASLIAFFSLTTLLAWEYSAAATPKSETVITPASIVGKNITTPQQTVFPSPVTVMELLVDAKVTTDDDKQNLSKSSRLVQALPNPNQPTQPIDVSPVDENQGLNSEDVQEELGEIEIIQPVKQPAPRRQPLVQLLLRSSTFTSSNITGLEISNPSNTVFINSATVLATPQLSEDTRLIAAAGAGLVRYATEGDFNYNFFNFNVGVQQRLAPGMYGQIGWVQERLHRDENGDRILLDDSVRLTLGRQDQLDQRLRLDSFYELRASFTEPNDQSRLANTLGARLRYDFTPKFQAGFSYQLSFKDYTQQDRFDTQHQLGLDAIYSLNSDFFVGGSASYFFGASSDSAINLDNFSLGINLGLNVRLF